MDFKGNGQSGYILKHMNQTIFAYKKVSNARKKFKKKYKQIFSCKIFNDKSTENRFSIGFELINI